MHTKNTARIGSAPCASWVEKLPIPNTLGAKVLSRLPQSSGMTIMPPGKRSMACLIFMSSLLDPGTGSTWPGQHLSCGVRRAGRPWLPLHRTDAHAPLHLRTNHPGHEFLVADAERFALALVTRCNVDDHPENFFALLLHAHGAVHDVATVDVHIVGHPLVHGRV